MVTVRPAWEDDQAPWRGGASVTDQAPWRGDANAIASTWPEHAATPYQTAQKHLRARAGLQWLNNHPVKAVLAEQVAAERAKGAAERRCSGV